MCGLLRVSLCFCLSICLSVCLHVCRSLFAWLCVSDCLRVSLSVCPSIWKGKEVSHSWTVLGLDSTHHCHGVGSCGDLRGITAARSSLTISFLISSVRLCLIWKYILRTMTMQQCSKRLQISWKKTAKEYGNIWNMFHKDDLHYMTWLSDLHTQTLIEQFMRGSGAVCSHSGQFLHNDYQSPAPGMWRIFPNMH